MQSTEEEQLVESVRITENAIYRTELMEICEKYRHSLSLVASVDELASHLGPEWFEVHELVGMAMTSLYLARRTIEKEVPF